MKKILTLLLALMMMVSVCASAADTTGTLTVGSSTSKFDSTLIEDGNTDPRVQTELWLQVKADGQIDVTVPLLLVFKTDIQGGGRHCCYGLWNY